MNTSPELKEAHLGGTSLIRTLRFPFTCSSRVVALFTFTWRNPLLVPPGLYVIPFNENERISMNLDLVLFSIHGNFLSENPIIAISRLNHTV